MFKTCIESEVMTADQISFLKSSKSEDFKKLEHHLFFTGNTGVEGTHTVELKNFNLTDVKKILNSGIELFTWSHSNDHELLVHFDSHYLESDVYKKDQELEHFVAPSLDPDLVGETSPNFILGISVIYEEDLVLLMNWIINNK